MINPKINEGWKTLLKEEFEKPYFYDLRSFLIEEKKKYNVYPPGNLIFNAFDSTPPDKVKVVLLGQDPYHGKGQAHGLCFSVPDGIKPPPSLINIYKEMNSDLGLPIPQTGNLQPWTKQGILLLNATLTVRANQPLSHQNKGWELFTNTVIRIISEKKTGIVFLLWGRHAQEKESLIDTSKHFILKAAHPSPFSANNGFFGCKHFSKTNEILRSLGKEEIDWKLN
ncbi:MAG: uracil-DNA glycosylase [Bacteroidota bacterium]|nr:uracil-DNA glycosylase [Bacteroidota bacterium]MDP4274927.1 uracil-DNA glycosylase [Bacteroidota bacterium]